MLKKHSESSASVDAGQSKAQASDALAASETAILDPQALARLQELDPSGETGLLERVLRAFEVSVARLLPQLQDARSAGDLQAIRHVVHTLKSSSASIGALKLSQLCAEGELMVRQSDTDGLDECLDAVVAQTAIALDALKKLLGAGP
jgi:HPt (histidine-containing phosphotransfer) domain-containing protein